MRAVVQRVSRASVSVGGEVVSSSGPGLLVLLGVGKSDTEADADYLVGKVAGLRVFEDEEGRMNKSLVDTGGELMVVSQFTLFGDARKGKRPSFTSAAKGGKAEELYEYFVFRARESGLSVGHGAFGEMMQVELINDGPVTILLDTERLF